MVLCQFHSAPPPREVPPLVPHSYDLRVHHGDNSSPSNLSSQIDLAKHPTREAPLRCIINHESIET